MKKYTLKDIVNGQAKAKQTSLNTDLFVSDRQPLEQLQKDIYSFFAPVSSDHQHDIGEHDKLVEGAVAVLDGDFYHITATTTSFNGELQVNFTEQQITLKGLNFFTKDCQDLDLTEVYNDYLQSLGYEELTIDDIKEIGEINSEFNCTTLKFKDEEENMHYLTVNAKNQLSSVTVKQSGREAKPKQGAIQSAF